MNASRANRFGALAILTLALALSTGWLISRRGTHEHATTTEVIDSSKTVDESRLTLPRRDVSESSESRAASASLEGAAAQNAISAESTTTNLNVANKRRDADSNSISEMERLDALHAQGRTFPVSAAVTQRCGHIKIVDVTCTETFAAIRKLAGEPRDIGWARDTEERLEKAIEALGPGKFLIRSLECRTNRCAVEVTANAEMYGGRIVNDPQLEHDLIPDAGTLGYETGENGQQIVITVFAFKRRAMIKVVDGKLVED